MFSSSHFRRLYDSDLKRRGSDVTLIFKTTATYDPETGVVSGEEQMLTVPGSRRNYSLKDRENEAIQATDFMLHISALSVANYEPFPTDGLKVSINRIVYEIVNVTPHYTAGGQPDRYTLQVRS